MFTLDFEDRNDGNEFYFNDEVHWSDGINVYLTIVYNSATDSLTKTFDVWDNRAYHLDDAIHVGEFKTLEEVRTVIKGLLGNVVSV